LSRSWPFVFVLFACAPIPATAQVSEADRELAERMMARGRITQDKLTNRCSTPERRGDIVVCAPKQDEFRMPSTADSDPNSKEALDDGQLRAPDVAGNGIFKGKATMGFGSVTQPYIIDLSSIPKAPEGSDADKIAKGEMRAN